MNKYSSKLTGNGNQEKGSQFKAGKANQNAFEETGRDVRNKMDNYYDEIKEGTAELLEEGKKKIKEAQYTVKEYSNELAQNVRNHPFTALLIAGGVGFILSALLKK